MTDLATMFSDFLSSLGRNPLYLLLFIGGIVLLLILLVVRRIHKIHGEEIFVHQAWGANWKGR